MAEDGRVVVGINMQNLVADPIETAYSYDLSILFKYHNHPLSQNIASLCTQIVHDHTARLCDTCLHLRLIARITQQCFPSMDGYMVNMDFQGFCV